MPESCPITLSRVRRSISILEIICMSSRGCFTIHELEAVDTCQCFKPVTLIIGALTISSDTIHAMGAELLLGLFATFLTPTAYNSMGIS
jgi:hypothetical protein